ncbi:hypothetical protein FHX35_001158 [Auritidibacter ignavus]|nr:hypothetical protein [Auritidibacter ignavus]
MPGFEDSELDNYNADQLDEPGDDYSNDSIVS